MRISFFLGETLIFEAENLLFSRQKHPIFRGRKPSDSMRISFLFRPKPYFLRPKTFYFRGKNLLFFEAENLRINENIISFSAKTLFFEAENLRINENIISFRPKIFVLRPKTFYLSRPKTSRTMYTQRLKTSTLKVLRLVSFL